MRAYCPGIDQHNIIDRETGSPAGQGSERPIDQLIRTMAAEDSNLYRLTPAVTRKRFH
jgi:hypothetical protein